VSANGGRSEKNAIFVELNANFYFYAKVFLRTLAKNYPGHPPLFVYHTDLSEAQQKYLASFKNVQLVRCTLDDFRWGPPMATHSVKFADARISYLRFLIWTDRFAEYDKVLHLDTDMLILGGYEELFKVERFTAFPEAYAGDDVVFYDPRNPELLKLLKEDGIESPRMAANAGVFLVPKADRTPEDRAVMERLMTRYKPFIKWSDQSIINLWMAIKGYKPVEEHRFNYLHKWLDAPGGFRKLRDSSSFHFNGVDLVFRPFFVRLANVLRHLPFAGWPIYRSLYHAAQWMLDRWRRRPAWFCQPKKQHK
jgi:hypothetical protein